MPESRLEYLFNRYVDNNYTIEDERELILLLAQPENKAVVQNLIDRVIKNTGSEIDMPDIVSASILRNIQQHVDGVAIPNKNTKAVLLFWARIAAVLLLFIGGAAYWIANKNYIGAPRMGTVAQTHTPIWPAENRALLMTSDGSTIVLDTVQNGAIIQKVPIKISKQDGLLIYNISAASDLSAPVVFSTLSTPRGKQYQVVLPDSSKVWLNAASSLRFPSAFNPDERIVELVGEAYFEVAKNKKKPFKVKVGEMEVTVLGTHFNINAYPNENTIKTSLLEGSIKIAKGSKSEMLKPGQQAVLDNENQLKIAEGNMDEVMAWKNGLFQFEGTDIAKIMREIGRWYNVEIVYSGNVPIRKLKGKISRNAELSDVLKILTLSDVRFSVVGNKIIVQ